MTSGAESVSAGRPRLLRDCLRAPALLGSPRGVRGFPFCCPLATWRGVAAGLDGFAVHFVFFPELVCAGRCRGPVWGPRRGLDLCRRRDRWRWLERRESGFGWRELGCLLRNESVVFLARLVLGWLVELLECRAGVLGGGANDLEEGEAEDLEQGGAVGLGGGANDLEELGAEDLEEGGASGLEGGASGLRGGAEDRAALGGRRRRGGVRLAQAARRVDEIPESPVAMETCIGQTHNCQHENLYWSKGVTGVKRS